MVLVDFKGGATFAGMSELPHVSAVITNLADELTLVDRMQDALSGEMVRRQELLRDAGNFASIRDYEKARAAGERPAPAAVAVHRGRRVLRDALRQAGVHRPVRRDRPARPLARAAPAARLAAARGGPAARPGVAPVLPGRPAHLLRGGVARRARRPGRLRAARRSPAWATSSPTRRRCCGSRPPTSPGRRRGRVRRVRRDEGGDLQGILPFTISEVLKLDPVEDTEPEPDAVEQRRRPGDAARHRGRGSMVGHGPAAHQVWLPPLDVPDTLDELMPDLARTPSSA